MTSHRRRARRAVAPLLGLALLGTGWSAAASAQQPEGERLVLRAVDARQREAVQAVFSWAGDESALDDARVLVDGDAVDVTVQTAADAGISNDIVFVVDSSTSTDADGLLTNAKQAIVDFAGDLPAGTRAAVIMAGAAAQTLEGRTADVADLTSAAERLTPTGEGGVLAGVLLGTGLVNDGRRTGNVGTIVLITDGAPEESITATQAEAGLDETGALLHVIALTEGGLNQGLFRGLAEGTGGTFATIDNANDLGDELDELNVELRQLGVAIFESEVRRGVLDISVEVGGSTTAGSFIAGGNLVGPNRLEPRPGVEPSGPSFLRTSAGRSLAIGGVLVAAALFAWALASIFVRESSGLTAVLRPYSDGFVAEEAEGGDENPAYAQTALLRRAVAATEQFADRQGFLTRVEKVLEKADLPLRAGEAMFFYLIAVLLLLVLALVLTSNALGAFVIGLFGILIPPATVSFLANRKKKQFEALLPDTLQLLSSTLRAGYSMMQGVEAVSQEVSEPMGKELRRVVTEARLGRPLEESLDGVAERMGSADFSWAVMAIRIQREVGGNLSELLLTVAETMTQRERLRRDIRALTAEGRISAYVLGGLPLGLGAALYVLNPDYIGTLFDHSMGQLMLAAGLVMMIVGFVWMSKIIKIEI